MNTDKEHEESKRLAEFITAANLGGAAKDFINTDLGRLLAKNGLKKREAAVSGIMAADPADVISIQKYQLQYKQAQHYFEPLTEAILVGEQAKETIKREGELHAESGEGRYQY